MIAIVPRGGGLCAAGKSFEQFTQQKVENKMKKRIINYRLKIDNLLANPDKISKEEWKKILQEHLTQIGFFQHERLVHLIVTVTFAILTMMSIIASIMISNPMLLVLTLLFLVLLVPYIMHYYTLENEVQKMYTQYDEILKHLS